MRPSLWKGPRNEGTKGCPLREAEAELLQPTAAGTAPSKPPLRRRAAAPQQRRQQAQSSGRRPAPTGAKSSSERYGRQLRRALWQAAAAGAVAGSCGGRCSQGTCPHRVARRRRVRHLSSIGVADVGSEGEAFCAAGHPSRGVRRDETLRTTVPYCSGQSTPASYGPMGQPEAPTAARTPLPLAVLSSLVGGAAALLLPRLLRPSSSGSLLPSDTPDWATHDEAEAAKRRGTLLLSHADLKALCDAPGLAPSEVDERDQGTPDDWVPRHKDLVRLTGEQPSSQPPRASLAPALWRLPFPRVLLPSPAAGAPRGRTAHSARGRRSAARSRLRPVGGRARRAMALCPARRRPTPAPPRHVPPAAAEPAAQAATRSTASRPCRRYWTLGSSRPLPCTTCATTARRLGAPGPRTR